MDNHSPNEGPGKGLINVGQRMVTTLVSIVETRVRLAIVELEEEKANLIQMLLMVGLTMLFTAFGLMSLMILVIVAVEPQYRLMAIAVTTGVLFALALILGIWVIVKSRRSTLLSSSREELSTDRKLLEERQS
ncbi:phage holin family protein [Tatumella terrea]|uniref:Phage holin family protein n=1 Tax=Tatumella terrea TaxID=419007 RepID=A0ABW1W071_9GAMM|nr:phage holin family protein [Tatumella sp. JGM118]MBS0908937.1 phage holin family protein [Tatumella sp. JGM118]